MEINKKDRTELKQYFKVNDKPTQQQFADFIDASINQGEDGMAKVQGNPLAIQAEGESAGTQEVLDLFTSFANDNPQWSLNLNPRVDLEESQSNQPGLNIKDATGQSRLFIKSSDGTIGMGTIETEARLTIQGAGSGSLITAISNTEQHSRVFEVADDGGDGILSMRGGDAQENIRLSGSKEKPSFFLGKVGVGINNPDADLQVGNENVMLRVTNTGESNDTEACLGLYHSKNNLKSWRFSVKKGLGNLEFIPIAGEDKKLIMKPDGRLEVSGGVLVGKSNRTDHLEADGALYRKDNNVFLTVDDHFYIRDKGSGSKMHFDTNNGRLAIGGQSPQAPLSIGGAGKEAGPDESMHITNQTILFGGNNAGKQQNSAKISAGTHVENSLNIVGMASGTSNVDRKVDVFAEGGLTVRGHIKTPINQVVAFSVSLKTNMTGGKNPIIFGQVNNNYGNHFKDNTHFIAPVKGLYLFTMCMRNNTDNDVGWKLRLNDTGFVNAHQGEAEQQERSWIIATAKLHMNSRTVMTLLNEGDKVHIEQFGSGGNDKYSSGFEGILLQALT